MDVAFVLQIVLVVLKAADLVQWSWLWVLSPLLLWVVGMGLILSGLWGIGALQRCGRFLRRRQDRKWEREADPELFFPGRNDRDNDCDGVIDEG